MKKNVLIVIVVFLCTSCASIMGGSSSKISNSSRNTNGIIYEGAFGYKIQGSGESRTVIIVNYAYGSNEVVIPDVINGIPVTKIDNGAFKYKGLTSVTIPDSVIVIEHFAFEDNRLTSVTIPNSVIAIGQRAFANNLLTSVTISESATIWPEAFADNLLTSVTIPESAKTIGYRAFINNRLTSVIISNGVNIIGDRAFANNQLTSVIIPESVTTIHKEAFIDNRLTSIAITNGVTTIGERAFANNQLTSVIIPESVTNIEHGAFKGTNDLYDVVYLYGRSGTYELKNNQWYYNETVITQPAQLICHFDRVAGGVIITGIDNGETHYYRSDGDYFTFYLMPGFHKIKVIYIGNFRVDNRGNLTSYSHADVAFEHALVLESGIYDLTGTQQGNQILFQIKKRN